MGGEDRHVCSNSSASRRTDRAIVIRGRRPSKVRAVVKLRAQEQDRQEQRQNVDAAEVAKHLGNKTELRADWLRESSVEKS